jgi:hypothetical protein
MANSEVFLKEGTKPANKQVFILAAEHQEPLDTVFTMDDQWYSVLGSRMQPLWNDPNTKAKDLMAKIKPEIDGLVK